MHYNTENVVVVFFDFGGFTKNNKMVSIYLVT